MIPDSGPEKRCRQERGHEIPKRVVGNNGVLALEGRGNGPPGDVDRSAV